MANVSLDISKADLRRIRRKLDTFMAGLVEEKGPVLKVLFKLVTEYSETVASGMGVLSPPSSSMFGTGFVNASLVHPFMGDRVTVHWQELADFTIARKQALNLELSIWAATGDTKRAVKPWVKAYKHTATVFGGIDAAKNPLEARKALATETGADGSWAERALFTEINEIFVRHYSDILDSVQLAIRDTADKVKWGN